MTSGTFVPSDEVGCCQGNDIKYNEIAAKIMNKHVIPVNDLHRLTASFGQDRFTCPGDGDYSEAGTLAIAEQVAKCAGVHLEGKGSD